MRRDDHLDQLRSADLVLSYWMGPAIAHTLISFGFEDGRHVVFSLEIRKERGESFSALGGFFRKFEMTLVPRKRPTSSAPAPMRVAKMSTCTACMAWTARS